MFTHKIEYSSPDGDTLYCEVDYECKFGSPGNLSGPPEDCYPPEPHEISIVAIRPIEHPIFEQLLSRLEQMPGSEQTVKEFWAPIIEWIEEHCYEELSNYAEEYQSSLADSIEEDEMRSGQ